MKISKILVPVKGIPIDDQAVKLACQTARLTKAHVALIHIIQVSRALPLEVERGADIEHGEQVLDHADKLAQSLGVHPETELLQARAVGPVILEEATRRASDVIIMGVPYRRPLDEFPLGTAVRHVLKNAACQVWLCREEANDSAAAPS